MSQKLCATRAVFWCGRGDCLSHTDSGLRGRALLGRCALAIGYLTLFSAPGVAGCHSGSNSTSFSDLLTSWQCQAIADYPGATAVGSDARTFDRGATAFGASAFAPAYFATAIGYRSGAVEVSRMGAGSTIVGGYAGRLRSGVWSVAIGAGSDWDLGANAVGSFGIAIGGGDHTDRSGARASGNAAIAIGHRSTAGGEGYASAFGYNARADIGLAPTAIGTDATAKGTNASAFGRFSSATAVNSTALGSGAQAKKKGAVALGYGSIANERNVVSVGSDDLRRRIINVANAVNLTDAVNLRQVRQMIAAAATAGAMPVGPQTPTVSVVAVGQKKSEGDIDELQKRLAALDALLRQQQQRIAELENRIVAAARAAK